MSDPFLQALDARTGAAKPVPHQARAPEPVPVDDGRSAVLGVYPNARITDNVRDPNSPLGRANPDSWHNRSKAAVDVAPMEGMTFDQYVQGYRDKGYPIIEQRDETGPNHPSWATGPNWHVVLGKPAQAPPVNDNKPDPFLDALDAQQNGQSPATPPAGAGGGGPPANPNVPPPTVPPPQEGLATRAGRFAASLDPWSDAAFNGTNLGTNLQDRAGGAIHGAAAIPETLLHAAAGAIDLTGYGHKTADALRRWSDKLDTTTAGLPHDPNSNVSRVGNIAGEVATTLPLAEVKLLEAPSIASKLGAGVARYGDMAVQGAAAGGLLSKGKDVGTNMAAGAVLAPALGGAVDAAGPRIAQAVDALAGTSAGKALAARLAGGAADVRPPEAELPPLAEGQQIRTGAQMAEVPHADLATPTPKDAAEAAFEQANADKVGTPEYVAAYKDKFGEAPPIEVPFTQSTKIPPEALGSRGARTGIEAHDQMPPEVAKVYQPLVAKGVAPDEALREADIIANGGSPTAANVTRNPAQMQAEREGAKAQTPEGQALNAQAASNNQALHDTAQKMVADNGGAPEPGSAMQTAAERLKAASDAEYQGVNDAYAQARATDGDARVRPDRLREMLATPEARAQVAGGGPEGQMVTTVRKLVDLYSDGGKTGLTPEQYNSIQRIANGKYDPMGGGVNHWVGEVNKAADEGLDGFDNAGPAYKAARAKMRAYAGKYRDPKGVAGLIKSDAQGNLVGDDTWRAAENMIGAKNDKPFLQIVKQLKANGDTQPLAKLKASVIQDAYEAATGRSAGNAADQLGNSPFSGSRFHARLNQIGQAKLNALFSPQEIARLASLGRAGVALNEAVPGTVNTSNTASAVLNALGKTEKKAPSKLATALKTAVDVGGAVAGSLHGGAEGAGVGALAAHTARGAVENAIGSASTKANAAKLADALRAISSPEAARVSDAAAARRLADALRRRGAARAAAERTAPAAAAVNEGRK